MHGGDREGTGAVQKKSPQNTQDTKIPIHSPMWPSIFGPRLLAPPSSDLRESLDSARPRSGQPCASAIQDERCVALAKDESPAAVQLVEHVMESSLHAACEHLARIVSPPRHHVDDPEPAVFAPHVLCGTAQHALAVDRLVELGVTAVLNCAPAGSHDCRPLYVERDIAYCALEGCEDIPGYELLRLHLADAMGFVREHTTGSRAGGRVLVHCYAGSNRSATLAIAYLLCTTGEPLPVVVERCFARRPFILKNASFRRQLVELCHRERIPLEASPSPAADCGGASAAEPSEPARLDSGAEAPTAGVVAEEEASATDLEPACASIACDSEPFGQRAGSSQDVVELHSAPTSGDALGPPREADPDGAGVPAYTLGEKLGQGAFATVYACSLHGVDEPLAAKVVMHNKWVWIGGRSCSGSVAVGSIQNEVEALRQAGAHPNIVRFFGLCPEPEREVLLLGRASGGDLASLAASAPQGMEPSAVRSYMRGLLRALAHCHRRRVVHRDVKLDNILLDAHDRAVLCDFGHAAVLSDEECRCGRAPGRLYDKCGTRPWCAPEIISCGVEGYDGPPVDFWSAGAGAALAPGHMGTPRRRLRACAYVAARAIPSTPPPYHIMRVFPLHVPPRSGVSMFAMLSGKMPFAVAEAEADPRFARAAEAQSTGQSISALLLSWLGASGDQVRWSRSATQLLDSLLCIDPATRSTADDGLASTWIREHDATVVASPPSEPDPKPHHVMPELKLRGCGGAPKRGSGGGRGGLRKVARTSSYGTEQHEERTCIWRGVRTETRADVLLGAMGTHHAAHHPIHEASCVVGQMHLRYDVPMSEWLREENAHGFILPTIIIEVDRPFKVDADNNNNYRWGGGSPGCMRPEEPNGGYPR